MTPFDDNYMVDRILNKLDGMDIKIDDLCARMTKNEVILNTHLDFEREKAVKKEGKFYVFMAVIGLGLSIMEIIRSGIFG